jgi:hypothetical protein
MSNLTMMSPFLFVCLGYGKPSPAMRFSVVGLIISFNCICFFRPSKVGTCIVTPSNAFEKKLKAKINVLFLSESECPSR